MDSFASPRRWTRFQNTDTLDTSPHIAALVLDADGTIQHLSRAARTLLEYKPSDTVDCCFFTHVHGHNLHRVMQDLAHMVHDRKQKASWLLRLRTGRGRWQWYRAQVRRREDEAVRVVVKLSRT
jgi:PAS domain-containing protein